MTARAVAAFAIVMLAGTALAEPAQRPAPEELLSGSAFVRPETRAMQDDSFANPGLIWVERGAALWRNADGDAGKSCADCHGDGETAMKGVGATYPKVVDGRLLNLSQRINKCRVDHMAARPLVAGEHEVESENLLSLEAYVKAQSAGMPMAVVVDGAAAPFYERGRKLYFQRVGQMDLACAMCHDDRPGHTLRAEPISQGHVNGFPAYILRWDGLASARRRFQFCNEQARAEPLAIGHDDYTTLELYVAWRGATLPVESPAVRRQEMAHRRAGIFPLPLDGGGLGRGGAP